MSKYDLFIIIGTSLKDNWLFRTGIGKPFSEKGQQVNILCNVSCTVSVTTTQPSCYIMKAPIKKHVNKLVWVCYSKNFIYP